MNIDTYIRSKRNPEVYGFFFCVWKGNIANRPCTHNAITSWFLVPKAFIKITCAIKYTIQLF